MITQKIGLHDFPGFIHSACVRLAGIEITVVGIGLLPFILSVR